MLSETARVRTTADVVLTELETQDGVLLHLTTKQYYSLNPTGVHIWKLFGPARTLAEVAAALTERYEVTPERALESVLALARELQAERLIEAVDGPVAA
jgi:hypothetical protein